MMFNEYMFKQSIKQTSNLRSYCRLEGLDYLHLKAIGFKNPFSGKKIKKEQYNIQKQDFTESIAIIK